MAENTAQNPYVNKVSYFGQTLIDLTGDTVTSASDIRYDKLGHTKSGATVRGNLHPRPEWLSRGDNAAWKYAFMNREVDWGTVLPLLEKYDEDNKCLVGFSVPYTNGWYNGVFFAVRSDSNHYALIYQNLMNDTPPIPIYATAAGTYTTSYIINNAGIDNVIDITFECVAGWNNVAVPLPTDPENPANPVTASCIFFNYIVDAGVEDLTQVAAGTPLAFGDYRPAPTGSITINANGTYRNLWQYAEVIINVPTSGTEEEATVEGNTLVFDGDTAVDGNTLTLALEAEVKDKTLVILGASGPDATIDGNTLTVNGTTDGETLNLDATVNDNILII